MSGRWQVEPLGDGVLHVRANESYAGVMASWQQEARCRDELLAVFGQVSFTAFRWETPPVRADTMERPFEFVFAMEAWARPLTKLEVRMSWSRFPVDIASRSPAGASVSPGRRT